jgi:hypothetical protein
LYLPDGDHVLVTFGDGAAGRSEVEDGVLDAILDAEGSADLPRLLNAFGDPIGVHATVSRDGERIVILVASEPVTA